MRCSTALKSAETALGQGESDEWDEQPGLREAAPAEGAGYAIGNKSRQAGRARAIKGS